MYAARVAGPQGLVVGVDIQSTPSPRVAGGAEIKLICGDINDPRIREEIGAASDLYDAVLSDMAPKTTGNRLVDEQRSLDLVYQALDVARELLRPGGVFYCKVFEGGDLKETLDRVGRLFNKVRIFKPKSSRDESREVFILATGCKKDREQETDRV